MNKAILIGNLANDPEVRKLADGTANASFRLAVQRKFANANGVKEADFINIVCWRQLAELVGKYLSKGRKCCVEGRIQTRSYEAQDGSKRYVTEIVADNVEFLSAKGDGAQDSAGKSESGGGFTEVDDDELPF